MTVKQLITELQKLDPTKLVKVYLRLGGWVEPKLVTVEDKHEVHLEC